MPAVGARVSVGASATALSQSLTAARYALLVTNRGTAAIDLGGPTVATGAGYSLNPGESVSIEVEASPAAALYGVTASGTVSVHVLQVGV